MGGERKQRTERARRGGPGSCGPGQVRVRTPLALNVHEVSYLPEVPSKFGRVSVMRDDLLDEAS